MDDTNNANINTHKGLIAWFARNSVAANLLMIFIIIGGLLTATTIRKQMFPQLEINWLKFHVLYPGAAPQEVEEGITVKIEEALETVQGLQRVITYSNRNSSYGYIRIDDAYDPQVILEEVKSQIDSIVSFPEGMERPKIERIKFTQEVLYMSLYGDLDVKKLKAIGQSIHDEIQQLPSVNVSDFYGGLDYEISIEVSKDKLREYNLNFNDIANAVRYSSRNMSAGQIRAENGYINLRVEKQAYHGYEFESLPLITLKDGTTVLLGDIAKVSDGFEEGIQYSKFNGKNAVTLFVGAANNQDITDVAAVVKRYVNSKKAALPDGVSLDIWVDMTYYLQGRLDMMLDNMKSGAILVFLMLALFLRIRLAFWVMMGLPVCFLGALLFMPMEMIDVTINVTSLFAFIMVLGVVVDDAIVMGESAHAEVEEKGHTVDNVIRGVKRVAMPATFGVLTTIAAFVPLLFGDGPSSAFGQSIGAVVILCLIFSLVESKLILPAHLVGMKIKESKANSTNFFDRVRTFVDNGLKVFIEGYYRRLIGKAIVYRYGVFFGFLAIAMTTMGLFAGGIVRDVGTPKIPHDFPRIKLEMNVDSAEKTTLAALLSIERTLREVDQKIESEQGNKMIEFLSVDLRSRNSGELTVKLVDPELRPMNTFELAELWRQALPKMPGVKSITIDDNLFGGGRDDGDISFRLKSKDDKQLLAAAKALKAKLNSLKGVGDVTDSRQTGVKEVQFDLKPLAYSMGLTLVNVARQVSNSFYGLEAQRILRDGEEIRVMIRYPESQRNAIGLVDNVMIQVPNGSEVPLSEIADIRLVPGVTRIRRENGNRTINVWGSVDAQQVEPRKIARNIRDSFMPELLKQYPAVKSQLAGRIQEEMDSAKKQRRNFILAMLVVFTLLAVPLRSYTQPLMIMSVIPFGVIGAVYGHIIMGMNLNTMSWFGILACAGVVVNDSLVMVDYINKARARGVALREAVIFSGCKRFRPIMLTSVTTFIGLVPIMLETSMQAKIVIPMAVSLSFGILFATLVTLLLIPALYIVLEDVAQLLKKILGKLRKESPALNEVANI